MHAGSMSDPRQHGQRQEEQHSAQASQSQMAAQEQPRAHPLKQKKCRALQISEESAQAVDVYNLQSPGLVLQDLTLVSLNEPLQQCCGKRLVPFLVLHVVHRLCTWLESIGSYIAEADSLASWFPAVACLAH